MFTCRVAVTAARPIARMPARQAITRTLRHASAIAPTRTATRVSSASPRWRVLLAFGAAAVGTTVGLSTVALAQPVPPPPTIPESPVDIEKLNAGRRAAALLKDADASVRKTQTHAGGLTRRNACDALSLTPLLCARRGGCVGGHQRRWHRADQAPQANHAASTRRARRMRIIFTDHKHAVSGQGDSAAENE